MILTTVKDATTYKGISVYLDTAIDWIIEHFNDEFVKGVYSIECPDATSMTVKCAEPALLPAEKATMEAHKRFIDIQIPLKGTEGMGWAPTESLKHERDGYNEVKDVTFYGDAAQCVVQVKYGQMAIFFPEDGHAPNIGLGNHRKLVVKVPVV